MFGKKSAIKKYIIYIPSELKRHYGKRKFYSKDQVIQVVEDLKLNSRYIDYAFLMFCRKEDVLSDELSESQINDMHQQIEIACKGGFFGAFVSADSIGESVSSDTSEYSDSGDS